MKNSITNAAEISVLPLIDDTYKTGGGPTMVGGTVVRARKGPVGSVVQATYANWENIFGTPYPARVGQYMEGLRHLNDACKACEYVNVVRVVAADARFPSLSLLNVSDKGAWVLDTAYAVNDIVTVADGRLICTVAHTSTGDAPTVAAPGGSWEEYTGVEVVDDHTYGSTLALGDGYFLQVWPIDGDPSVNRSLEIKPIINHTGDWAAETAYAKNDVATFTDGLEYLCKNAHTSEADEPNPVTNANWRLLTPQDKRFEIIFYDKTDAGEEYMLESYTVGILETDRDDMGRPAFIEYLLEQQSDRFRADVGIGLEWPDIQDTLSEVAKTAFAGGTNGSDPESQDWIDAWDLLRNERDIPLFLLFAAGNYDETVLANCIDIAEKRHVNFFFDVPYYLDANAALEWLANTSLSSRQASAYYCPFSGRDEWYGGQTAWGVSGAVCAACAKGDANFTGSTPGVHYSPAGYNRAKLDRTNIKPLFPEAVINRDDFHDARINPVVMWDDGGAVIDDSLTLHFMQNYSRFVWVNRIANYIDYRFLKLAKQYKHEPDGITRTGLTKGIKYILDELVTSGALSKPREPDVDGDEPYRFTVVQQEIDLWIVNWWFCPTGSARRIAGQPTLIR